MGAVFDDVQSNGTITAALRIAAPQLANGTDPSGEFATPVSNTIEWVAFDPSSVGLKRARGSIAIETDVAPPIIWLKTSSGGGSPMGWSQVIAGSGFVTGAGTVNTVPKFGTASSIENSDLTDNGTTLTYTGSNGISAAVVSATAEVQGGVVATGYNTAFNVGWWSGSGSPEGAQAAPIGSLYSDAVGGKLYVKNTGTGNTGWQLVTSV